MDRYILHRQWITILAKRTRERAIKVCTFARLSPYDYCRYVYGVGRCCFNAQEETFNKIDAAVLWTSFPLLLFRSHYGCTQRHFLVT